MITLDTSGVLALANRRDPDHQRTRSGSYTLDCGSDEFARIRELIHEYADLPLGFADASVIACAERSGGRVLTFDMRDFGVVARAGRISIAPC